MTESTVKIEFKKIAPGRSDTIAILSLNRPQAANAFTGEMVDELCQHLTALDSTQHCRVVVLRGEGKNFCAGADLHWMKSFAAMTKDKNLAEANKMLAMYEQLNELSIPTIAMVQGAVYGGAVGLVAACDWAIAAEDAKFCLSEVKVGLMPAVILPYVARKISLGQAQRYVLTGRVFSAKEAESVGLIQRVVANSELGSAAREEVNGVLGASPEAQKALKSLYSSLRKDSLCQSEETAEAIAAIRVGVSGQAGINAFLRKQSGPWVTELSEDHGF